MWTMSGGMTMVGDMFNYGLKNTVNNLCGELANALASTVTYVSAHWPRNMQFTYFMTAGTTSPTTFKVRAGAPSTVTFNGRDSVAYLNNTMASSITITEIQQ